MTCSNKVACYFLTSPLGQLEVKACSQGIHTLQISGVISDDDFKPVISKEVRVEPMSHQQEVLPVVTTCIEWLNNFFHNRKKAQKQSTPPICHFLQASNKAPFTQTVWKSLTTNVPYGETVSYGELAKQCGSAGASRAVGQAMKNNQVGLIIPCHRVINSNGKTGNYSGGKKNSVKVWLLEHEEGKV